MLDISWLSILVKSIDIHFGRLFYLSLLERLALIVYYSKFYYTELIRIDNRSLFWSSLLEILSLQAYFSRVYTFALIVNFSGVSL